MSVHTVDSHINSENAEDNEPINSEHNGDDQNSNNGSDIGPKSTEVIEINGDSQSVQSPQMDPEGLKCSHVLYFHSLPLCCAHCDCLCSLQFDCITYKSLCPLFVD